MRGREGERRRGGEGERERAGEAGEGGEGRGVIGEGGNEEWDASYLCPLCTDVLVDTTHNDQVQWKGK